MTEVCRGGTIKASGRTATGHLSDRCQQRGDEEGTGGKLVPPQFVWEPCLCPKQPTSAKFLQLRGRREGRLGRVLRLSLG